MAVTLPNSFVSGTTIAAADVNANFNAVAAKFNAGISDADINAAAGISLSKLAGRYEHMRIQFWITSWAAAGNNIMQIRPIVSSATEEAWTVEAIYWQCSDTGNGAGQFAIDFGYYTQAAAPVWTSVVNVHTGITITNNSATAQTAQQATVSPENSALTFGAGLPTPMSLAVRLVAAGAGVLGGGIPAPGLEGLAITVALRRAITG